MPKIFKIKSSTNLTPVVVVPKEKSQAEIIKEKHSLIPILAPNLTMSYIGFRVDVKHSRDFIENQKAPKIIES